MKQVRRNKLESKGWKVGSASEFLGLTPEEEALVEMKLSLSRNLKELRIRKGLSQVEFAKRINSSQSRVAKMEAGEAVIPVDLLFKSMLALGATQKDIARAISSRSKAA